MIVQETGGLATNVPTLAVSAATFLLAGTQWFMSHRKGRTRDRHQTSSLESIERRLTGTLGVIDEKLDESIEEQRQFAREQLEVNAKIWTSIMENRSHLIGPDGRNGLRSRVEKLERDHERDHGREGE